MRNVRFAGLFLVLSMGLSLMSAAAQDLREEQKQLTLGDVKNQLKQSKQYLEQAKERGKADDAQGVETALQNYNRGVEGLDHALANGRFSGSVEEREEAFARVEKATRKNGEVLSGLLTKVPEQARPAIERAMTVSQKGRTTALENLQRARGERQNAERARQDSSRGQQPGFAGAGGVHGQGAGGSGGRPGGAGSSKPGGRPGGKPPR